ncbi:hypothetical protein GCM10023310_70420 [Paenibacillus vulneris]|uniref:Uncharacterized protein n=1 Tax=Paenibacillus vulneris TaxID=1133364 RepID=A0ABW3UJ25_9BACL
MTSEQERQEIRKTLENASPIFKGFGNYTNADIFLAINAYTWLGNALDREEKLIEENKHLKGALEQIIKAYGWGDPETYSKRMYNEAKSVLDLLDSKST